jgi:predicted MPP superfamily phosphohydrolase
MHSRIFFFLFAFLVYTSINIYVFYRSRQALPQSKIIRTVFYVVYFFFYSAFIIAMLGRNMLALQFQKILYFPGTVWMGMVLYLLLFFFLTDIIYFFSRRYLSAVIKARFRKIQVVSGYVLVVCLAIYGYYQFNHPKIVEQKIHIAKNAGEYKRLKVVGVSDLHLGVAIDRKHMEKYVRLINDQHPDLILIAGDLIDNNALPLEKERVWETIDELQAPLGVYYCLGNHDYLVGIESAMKFLRKTDMHLLIDSTVVINNSIQIVGRDDKQGNHNRKSLEELVKNTDKTLPLLLLDHEPYLLNEAEENGIDFQLSGHTHRGQIFPANVFVDRMYELSYGYKQKGNTHYYVSSGLGLWGPPFRIGTQSEIVIFDIEFD